MSDGQAGVVVTALDTGYDYTCVVLNGGAVRCWGNGADGILGQGNTELVGDDETPASVGPVDFGAASEVTSVSTGFAHACALLDDGTVRCWGRGDDGRLGYGNTDTIGDDETPGSVGPVDLGAGRTATAITAGDDHTCALLDDRTVRCWGFAIMGQLGYGNRDDIGYGETMPAIAGPVDVGRGRTATAIDAGGYRTCALLDDGAVRCWGDGQDGGLGYGNTEGVGDDETPGSVTPLDLGAGGTAVGISVGYLHACVVLDDGTVRCWGNGSVGALGLGEPVIVGDDETPGSLEPVDLGAEATVAAVHAGGNHTCVMLQDGTVRCWGQGLYGQLGYGNHDAIGDDEAPASIGAVDVGT
jgi:alpha-tubulin suppressor-like RCC1 family protein